MSDPERGKVLLPAGYVTRHVELGWAVTGYGNQGVTVDHGICVVEAGTSRPSAYVGLTRGRRTNTALVPDPDGLTEPAEMLDGVIDARPPALPPMPCGTGSGARLSLKPSRTRRG